MSELQVALAHAVKLALVAVLAGLFVREKGGFYHDGRFADYRAVIDHYDRHFGLRLTDAEKRDLAEFLKQV